MCNTKIMCYHKNQRLCDKLTHRIIIHAMFLLIMLQPQHYWDVINLKIKYIMMMWTYKYKYEEKKKERKPQKWLHKFFSFFFVTSIALFHFFYICVLLVAFFFCDIYDFDQKCMYGCDRLRMMVMMMGTGKIMLYSLDSGFFLDFRFVAA